MKYWQWFWIFSLVAAGAAFAFITVIVSVKGFRDLREFFSELSKQQNKE
jgi:hypothetical protein